MNVLGVMAQSACADAPGFAPAMKARDFMATKLVTLSPGMDAFDAIDQLLSQRISGAPVLDSDGRFLGVFSEKDSMRALLSAACEQLPSAPVETLMNRDLDRTVSPETDLFEVAKIFVETPYRRLAVVEDGRLVGQISRRDVLKAEQKFTSGIRHRVSVLSSEITALNGNGDGADSRSEKRGEDVALPSNANQVSYFMDESARTISEGAGFLSVAQIFRDTPYRRLPVVRDGKLVGQVSRRDLLNTINQLTAVTPTREKTLLYLSSLVDREDAPVF